MGHIEYSTPECLSLRDVVSFDHAGDRLLQSALESMGLADRVSFVKKQYRPPHGRDFRLPRELSDEAQCAIHATGVVRAALVPGHAPDFFPGRAA